MIKNVIRLNGVELIVTLEDGTQYTTKSCTDALYKTVQSLKGNKDAKKELDKLFGSEKDKEYYRIQKSSILTIKDGSAYMPEISNLTIPQMLAAKIAEAEENNDENAITAYKNFWTLLSLNPNTAVRDNLFWFLDKWGMSISKAGLIVAYRNVELKSKGVKYNPEVTDIVSRYYYNIKNEGNDPRDYNLIINDDKYVVTKRVCDNDIDLGNLADLYANIIFTNSDAGTVYTDNRTRKFEIRLGHIVSMPRKDCDETQCSCSRGLHTGARGWLKSNYCGQIGLKVLISPSDVVSVPREDNYGKMRCCAYYPMQVIKFNNDGDVDDELPSDGFEVDFLNKISYTGTINNEDNDNYKLYVPQSITKANLENIYTTLRQTASKINRKV